VHFVHDKLKESASPEARAAILVAHERKLTPMELHPGRELGLPAHSYVVTTTRLTSANRAPPGVGDKVKRWFQSLLAEEASEEAAVGLVVQFQQELAPKKFTELQLDLDLFVANWRMAESSLRLQDKLARDRMEMVKKSHGTV
jgi:hypothetical protein